MTTLTVVTGGSRGLGLAFVRDALERGDRVLEVSRSGPPAEMRGEVRHASLDLADPSAWSQLADHVAGTVRGLAPGDRVLALHNAGVLDPIGFAGEVDDAAHTTMVLVDVAAPVALGHLLLGVLAPREDLRRQLCMVSSGAAQKVYPGWAAYCAGKAAMERWVRVAGEEQSRRGGVEVSAVAPGVVATDMQDMIRTTREQDLPNVARFRQLHEDGDLAAPADAARALRSLLDGGVGQGAVRDLRDLG
jgi:NAD(P)-dependent dehydrogenase (short-subunit alcohol dehydrogenase family)